VRTNDREKEIDKHFDNELRSVFAWVCIALALLVFCGGVLGMPLGGLFT
jgi:hypothetical protein